MGSFFEKIRNQSLPANFWRLIVVDNGSTSLPDAASLPEFVELIVCSAPGSYAARNLALQRANADLIVFTDADCQPCENWLNELWSTYTTSGPMVILAGAVTVKKLTTGAPNDYEVYDILCGIPQKHYVGKRGYAVTANLAVPRDAFNNVGLFDGNRFSGGDAEFCKRALNNGYRLNYLPEAEVLHPARSTWEEIETKARRIKGGQIKNGPLARRLMFFIATFIYPFLSILHLLQSDVSRLDKRRAMRVSVRISKVQICEVLRLIWGGQAERR